MDFTENGRMRKDRILRESKVSYIHDKLVPILKEKIPEVWKENVNSNLELYGGEEVDYCDGNSFDGFMSTCSASIDIHGWTTVDYLSGSGYSMGNDKCKKTIERIDSENYAYAQEKLFDRYKDKIKEKGDELLSDKHSYDFTKDDVPHTIALALDLGGDDEDDLRNEVYSIIADADPSDVSALVRVIFHDDGEAPNNLTVMIFSHISFDEYRLFSKNGETLYENEFSFSESDDPEEVAKKILAEVETACKAI
jgi:hypothetical protein